MAKNFTNLAEDINLDSEVDKTLNRINQKKSIPRHIIIQFWKNKDKEKS